MSVILEFTVDSEEFTLGQVLSNPPPMRIELERIVPTGNTVMPFLWVTGEDFETFEQNVVAHPAIDEIAALDKVQDSALYRLAWHGNEDDLIRGITENGGTVLEAYGDDAWKFRIRLIDHDRLSSFYNYCTERGISLHIDRTHTLTDRTERVRQFGLSQEQREALLVGLRAGYFDTPSEASLDELAEELGISQQAMSDRIRRGTEQILREVLLSSASDFDEPPTT